MLLLNLINSPLEFAIYIIVILLALTVHEFAHAYVADKLGDDTPKLSGRLTLNPFAHIDLTGAIIFLIAGFGWGKPVEIRPEKLSYPRIDQLTVALAGPVSNFILALAGGLALKFLSIPEQFSGIISIFVFFNLSLMVFNLIPIPPLDGSKVLRLFMSDVNYIILEQMGFYILILFVIFSSTIPIIPFIMNKAVGFFFQLVTGHSIGIS